MIWLTWRQFRPQAVVAAVALIAIAILLAVTGPGVAGAYSAARISDCHASCAAVASSFLNGLSTLDMALYFGTVALMYVAPALMGLFWGAPLIARELEAGTHRLAWNQSVTRTRWSLAKLGLIGLAAMATAGVLSLMVTWWASPIDHTASLAAGPVQVVSGGGSTWFVLARIQPVIFAARGVTPLGYAAFGFVLGVAAGVLLRRTLAAIALTLVVFVAVQVVMPNLVRPHLIPPVHVTAPLNAQKADINLVANEAGGPPQVHISQDFGRPGAWVLSNRIVTQSGAPLTVTPAACQGGPEAGINGLAACRSALAAMHLRQSVSYQPASRFWPLQGIETGIYLVLAAGLGLGCVQLVRRRRTP